MSIANSELENSGKARVAGNAGTSEFYEEKLIALIRTQPDAAIEMVSALPEGTRARLAFFCYQRRHFHDLGLQIASTCSLGGLEDVAGAAGTVMFNQSRNFTKTVEQKKPSGVSIARNGRVISLAQFA